MSTPSVSKQIDIRDKVDEAKNVIISNCELNFIPGAINFDVF